MGSLLYFLGDRFDFYMYKLLSPSLARYITRSRGRAYLFKLHIDATVDKYPPSEAERKAAELIFQRTHSGELSHAGSC